MYTKTGPVTDGGNRDISLMIAIQSSLLVLYVAGKSVTVFLFV